MIDTVEIAALDTDESFRTKLANDVWLMDDHRWAFLIWKECRDQSGIERFSLVHADYHWDGVNDFYERPDEEAGLIAANHDRLVELVSENRLIRYDSFIAPAILRGFIDEVHFYCLQDDESDEGIDEDLLNRCGCRQFIHRDYRDLPQHVFRSPVIFDLCLDLFSRSQAWYEGDIWSDDEIDDFFQHMKPVIQSAVVVTVSMSFGYSGDIEDTRRLTDLILPKLMEMRECLIISAIRATL